MNLTFCEVINKLIEFWVSYDCGIAQGSNTEVGAGTLSPRTLLDIITNETYKICFVQPSTRPADGENANRLYTHHQFQVIIKDKDFTKSVKQIYLESLKAIGVDFTKNDIRFIEDDWKNPSVGAFGLGWEVWYNGMEVTQYTFMQQIGGLECDIVPVEITYGLERLVMSIQNKDRVMDIDYSTGKKYVELFKHNEQDFSAFALEYADIEMIKRHLADYLKEAKRFVELGNSCVGYDFIIKASHLVNLLDARKAISINQRTEFLLKMKTLVKQVAVLAQNRADSGFLAA
jgi:glycyl-tRNA synthetase alpha chain